MALPIRDGNQSPTTLSTIIVSNAHIPAHTVVSLGTQAITDIATAVSGVELGPNTLNALENITVTLGQVTITGGLTDAQLRASAVTIGGVVTATISGTPSVTFGTAVITGSTSVLNFPVTQPVSIASVTIGNSVTIGSLPNISGTVTVSNLPATQAVTFGQSTITGSVSVLNLPATQTVTFTTAPVTFGTSVITGSASILNFPATQTVTFTQASVTFGTAVVTGSTSILNFPASQSVTFTTATVTFGTAVITGSTSVLNFPATQTVTFSQAPVTFGLISGTVTANPTGTQTIAGTVTVGGFSSVSVGIGSGALLAGGVRNSGVEPLSLDLATGYLQVKVESSLPAGTNRIGVVTIGNIQRDGDGVQTSLLTEVGSGYLLNRSYLAEGTANIGVVTIGNIRRAGDAVLSQLTTEAGSGYLLTRSTLNAGSEQIGSVTASISGTVPISISSVTVGNSVTIGSLPLIAGTVTANVGNIESIIGNNYQSLYNLLDDLAPNVTINGAPSTGGTQPISGTVTIASLPALVAGAAQIGSVTASISNSVTIGSIPPIQWSNANGGNAPTTVNQNAPLPVQLYTGAVPSSVTIGATIANSVTIGSLPLIAGTVTANLSPQAKGPIVEMDSSIPADPKYMAVVGGVYSAGEYRAIQLGGNGEIIVGSIPAISGTVTVGALPSGALTTRFGSIATAGTAQITNAVTNTSRKYLLAQNISSSAVTIGIGFSPTTTQGIQLNAGAGLTFDAFCPNGAVYWLGSVTGASFTILEG